MRGIRALATSIQEIGELTESFNHAGAAIREGRRTLQRAYVEFVGSLASALDARDPYTAGHSRDVIDGLRDRLGRLIGQWGYVNYLDPSMPQWRHAYYGANLDRLQATARRSDPDRVLAFAQNVN